jgi:pimeloyl-ACP methyl ester carboxylesterase
VGPAAARRRADTALVGTDRQAARERGGRVIATDSRGHGDSSWDPAGDYATAALARDILAVVRQVGEPPVLMGASMGGMAALVAEGEFAPLSRGLILADIVPQLAPHCSYMREGP